MMLEGKTPWKGKNQKDLLNKLKNVPITTFMEGKGFDSVLSDFLKKALVPKADERMNIDQLREFHHFLVENINETEAKLQLIQLKENL